MDLLSGCSDEKWKMTKKTFKDVILLNTDDYVTVKLMAFNTSGRRRLLKENLSCCKQYCLTVHFVRQVSTDIFTVSVVCLDSGRP